MSLQPRKIFEFGESVWIANPKELKIYLQNLWNVHKNELVEEDHANNDGENTYQGFIQFDGNFIRAKNCIGFIQGHDLHLEIYPKVFKGKEVAPKEILKHLFYWFDYCRKWKFPFSDVQLDALDDIDLPELIINLIANQILEVVSTFPISLYQEVEEALSIPKGRINFNRYVNNSLSKGHFHYLECDHEPFLFDNKLNQTIKYVAQLLLKKAKYSETFKKINDIIFILDEVQDVTCTSISLNEIRLSPLFTEYNLVIDLCEMVLEQQVYSNEYNDQSHWSLLLPMEYIFEDFVAGFLEKHFSLEWKVEYQKSELYLTDYKVFQMQHDVFLTSKARPEIKIILDTKYKLRGDYKMDRKKGIAQSDMYQMASYAFRRGCTNVLLLYPNMNEELQGADKFTVTSGFDPNHKINITAAEIPFWSKNNFEKLTESLQTTLTTILQTFKA